MREEIQRVQWLVVALTEAVFFYGLVAGLIACVLQGFDPGAAGD